jgi:hypothetical protein
MKRFSRAIVATIDRSKILGVRADAAAGHRFTGIWPIVIGGRVFGRSWTRSPGGWFNTLLEDPRGTLQVGARELRVRAVHVRSARILDAIERAYAAKYPTPGSAKYVRGFRTARRRASSMEFRPR